MTDVVLDASAILADLYEEPGGDIARGARRGAVTSAVNYCEVLTDLIEMGSSPRDAAEIVARIGYKLMEADQSRAAEAAALYVDTRRRGVSLGDRFCLSLARELRLPVLTADRRWKDLDLGVEVRLIR